MSPQGTRRTRPISPPSMGSAAVASMKAAVGLGPREGLAASSYLVPGSVTELGPIPCTRPRLLLEPHDLNTVLSEYYELGAFIDARVTSLRRRRDINRQRELWSRAASNVSAILSALSAGSFTPTGFRELVYISNLVQNPIFSEHGLLLLDVFRRAHVDRQKGYPVTFRQFMRIETGSYSPQFILRSTLQYILKHMLQIGRLSSIASSDRNEWNVGLNISSTAAMEGLVLKSLYTLLYNREFELFEQFHESRRLLLFVHSSTRLRALQMLLLVAASYERLSETQRSLIRNAMRIISSEEFEYGKTNTRRDLMRIAHYATAILGYSSVSTQAGFPRVNPQIEEDLVGAIDSLQDPIRKDTASEVAGQFEIVMKRLIDPAARPLVESAVSLGELIRQHHLETDRAERALRRRERSRRSPSRAGRVVSALRGVGRRATAFRSALIRRAPARAI